MTYMMIKSPNFNFKKKIDFITQSVNLYSAFPRLGCTELICGLNSSEDFTF